MDVKSFMNTIGTQTPPPIVLFCPGKSNPKAREATYEPYLAERAIERFVNAIVDPSVRDLAYTVFHGDEAKPKDIIQEARTVPFLADRRVVLVRNADRFGAESASDTFLAYLDAPCEMTTVLLVAGQIDRRTRFFKACEKAGAIVECPMLTEREAEAWASAEAQFRGKALPSMAAQELIRRSGAHLSDVNNALNIVIAYVGDRDKIAEADVIAACADVAEEAIWTLTDAIAESRTADALESLRNLMDLGKQEDEIIGTINWLLKSAYAVAASTTGPSTLSPFVARKVKPLSDKLGLRKIRDAFILCTDTHFMIRSTGVNGPLALELLVVKLAAPSAPRSLHN